MLHQIRLENFKAFRAPQVVRLAPLTLIYGPNSGGKSSILQSLLFLKQSLTAARPVFRGASVDLGSFASTVFGHAADEKISMRVEFTSSEDSRSDDFVDEVLSVGLTVSGAAAPLVSEVSYGLGVPAGRAVELVRNANGAGPAGVQGAHFKFKDPASAEVLSNAIAAAYKSRSSLRVDVQHLQFYLQKNGFGTFDDRADHLVPGEIDDPWMAFETLRGLMGDEFTDEPPRLPRRFPELFALRGVVRAFESELSSVAHLGALRARPERRYQALDVSTREDSTGAGSLASLWRSPRSNQVIERISHWLAQCGVKYTLELRQERDVVSGESGVLVARDGSLELALTDVGFGISQVLPLLIAAATESGTVLVEQPEIHLHPRMQGNLADILIESAGIRLNEPPPAAFAWRPMPCWVVETHSETICTRVQRRIREGVVDVSNVAVLYVQPTPQGSEVLELRLDERGEFIDEWPNGFFDDSFKDLMS